MTPAQNTARQQAFVVCYLRDPNRNATQAAISAGYSAKGASVRAAELMKRPDIQRQIAAHVERTAERSTITLDEIVDELSKIARAKVSDYISFTSDGTPYVDLGKATESQLAALSEITVDEYVDGRGEDAREVKKVRFKLWDKRTTLVDLGKHLGGFVNRNSHGGGPDGTDAIPIEVRHKRVLIKRDREKK